MKPQLVKGDFSLSSQCTMFVSGHGPQSPEQVFTELAEYSHKHQVDRDIYGQGKSLNQFEAELAELLGKEAALFMPSGAMAQQIACRLWSEKKNSKSIAMHSTCQMHINEHLAYEVLHGLKGRIIGEPKRVLKAKDLSSAHGVACVVNELPMRQIGGQLPTWEEHQEFCQKAQSMGLKLHMDGARLWQCKGHFNKTYQEICSPYDSVYVSFYKDLGAMNGAMLLGPKDFIEESRIWLRRHGGNLFQQTPFYLSSMMHFKTRLKKMKTYRDRATELAQALTKLSHLSVIPQSPHTNMFHLELEGQAEDIVAARDRVAKEKGVWLFSVLMPSDQAGCWKTELSLGDASLAWKVEDIAQAFDELKKGSKA